MDISNLRNGDKQVGMDINAAMVGDALSLGVCASLVAAMRAHRAVPAIQQAGCDCLYSLCLNSLALQTAAIEAGALEPIRLILSDERLATRQRVEAAKALAQMSMQARRGPVLDSAGPPVDYPPPLFCLIHP